ncbi:hypothetical protein SAMN04487972_14714 [Paracoccus halophilus]|uniref:Uncharacterized protein n=1 Tax=Paracoccus halophilus TaxID=376733 RepID=A0A099EW14_9RHOB|nr:hypothetical protein [Paracoccus halophilus]KGJ02167.1 hypothetical protein IT41_18280 [Paracoccus halophilus]SFA62324.1 hypothetical protein SAMN04487972_14714 [Paracoccus halophilus]
MAPDIIEVSFADRTSILDLAFAAQKDASAQILMVAETYLLAELLDSLTAMDRILSRYQPHGLVPSEAGIALFMAPDTGGDTRGQSPQTRYGVPGSRLDLTTVAAGQPIEFIEMKFPGDRLRGTQLQLMNIPQDCNNCEGTRPVEQPTPAPQTDSNLGWWLLGAVRIVSPQGEETARIVFKIVLF